MLQVCKRDGTFVAFDLKKIESAIERAFKAEHQEYTSDIIELLALRVTSTLNAKIKNEIVGVEDIQDAVEIVLIQTGYVDVARSYMDYRAKHAAIRNVKDTSLDFKNVVDSYLRVADWRVKENSTVTYSVGGLILSNSGAVTANYWLSEIYDDEIANATATPTSICTTSPCSPATAPAGPSSSSSRKASAASPARSPAPPRPTSPPSATRW